MNGCQGNTTACDGREILPVRFGISHRERLMCARCREAAAALGALVTVVERRIERRPRWLDHVRASDRTGEVLAS